MPEKKRSYLKNRSNPKFLKFVDRRLFWILIWQQSMVLVLKYLIKLFDGTRNASRKISHLLLPHRKLELSGHNL